MDIYFNSLYKNLIDRFNAYISHLNSVLEWNNDKCDEKNNIKVFGGNKFGIYFDKPNTFSELRSGKIGGKQENNDIVAYYGEFMCPEKILECVCLECSLFGRKYESILLNDDLMHDELSLDDISIMKCVMEEYLKFYCYLYKKHNNIIKCEKKNQHCKKKEKKKCYNANSSSDYDNTLKKKSCNC